MDNVNIESVGGNSNLEDWASEETLQILVRLTLDNKKLATKQTAAITEILKLLKKVHKVRGGNSKNADEQLDQALSTKKQKSTKSQTAAEEENTESKKKNSKETAIATTALGAFAFALGSLVKLFTDSYGTYNNLIKYGAIVQGQADGLSGNFGDLGILMKSSGASLESLEKAITTSSRAIKMFGVKTFADTINEVSEQLYQFGFTNSESAEFIGRDLESRRRAGLINNITSAQYQQSLVQGTRNLMKFSKILGENWESLQQDSVAALDANDSFQLWIRTLGQGTEAYQNAYQSAQNVAMAFGPDLGAKIAEMAAKASGTQGIDETYLALVGSAGQEIADMLWNTSRQIRNGSLSTEKSFDSLAATANKVRNFGIQNQELLQNLKGVGKGETLKVVASLLSLAESADAVTAADLETIKAENEYLGAMKRMQSAYDKIFINFKATWIKGIEEVFNSPATQTAIEKLFNTISGIFGSDSFQRIISTGFSGITWAIEESVKWFTEKDKDDKTGFNRMVDSVHNFFTDNFPTMVSELTTMARSVISFIEQLRTEGLSSALFGTGPKEDPNLVKVQAIDISKPKVLGYDKEYAENLVKNKKVYADQLTTAESVWSQNKYAEALSQNNMIPKELGNISRAIVELARENVKDKHARAAFNKSSIPTIPLLPGMAVDRKIPTNVDYSTSTINSYSGKNLIMQPETPQATDHTAEELKSLNEAAETIRYNNEQTKLPEQDKIQPLVYTLDMLTSELQSLTLVPELLASINNALTSIKNGQNTRLA